MLLELLVFFEKMLKFKIETYSYWIIHWNR